jgi:hypothetical protein
MDPELRRQQVCSTDEPSALVTRADERGNRFRWLFQDRRAVEAIIIGGKRGGLCHGRSRSGLRSFAITIVTLSYLAFLKNDCPLANKVLQIARSPTNLRPELIES